MLGKILLVVAILLALAYLGLCALLHSQQRSLIYFPQATRADAARTNIAIARPDAVLRGWVVNPGRTDAIVYYGGNGESIESYRDAYREWFPGTTVYLVAYRGYGASDGEPSETALLGDALAVFDEVATRHSGGRVGVIGRSLGSGVASYVASQRRIVRLALVTPFDSLARVAQAHYPVFPVRWLLRDRYESFRYLPRHHGELLVLRAGRDEVIPARNTDRLIAAFPRPAQVVDFPDDDHNSLSNQARYWSSLRDFLQPADGTGLKEQAIR
ncbi:alpha/beta hydrolase [Pseudoxanthomonas putridarboris]|uniref:Alpha/beta hydrolase n=1 Tax=Pseudoxanthomonas putridarboris TaxID=752605 RepID=A0ABU9IZG6_9GAMM